MASVGIIAANHNTDGVAGLAPNVRIMPVRIFNEYGEGTTNNNITDAMTHAVTNGADIISNSWGYSDPNTGNSITYDANPGLTTVINNASQNGRSGLGTAIIFAAGNNGQDVTYPAFLSSVTAVGAIDNSNTVFNYSNTGSVLDLVAPSGEIGTGNRVSCGLLDTRAEVDINGGTVWTLDRDGASGWNPGNYNISSPNCFNEYKWLPNSGQPSPTNGYTSHYGGTSAAAPQVSGTAALMLSVNPNLTHAQIQTILENTADKVGPYTYSGGFNQNMGHGRLNAYKAVRNSLPLQYSNQSFTTSTSISNSAHIYGNTTIASGVTLTLPANKVLVLRGTVTGSNSKIKSYGKVIIEEGTTLNNVEIVMESGGYLLADDVGFIGKGIVFKSGSDGEVTNSGIRYAGKGVDIYGTATPLIQGNWIGDGATGIYVQSGVGSGAKIIDNYIYENSSQGIISYYSSPTIQYNYIYDTGYGFFGLGSSASFYRNRFVEANYGLFLINSPVQNAQRNYMRPINTDMIHAESPATVVIQNNDIIPTSGTDYAVRAKYGATVIAYNNYWAYYSSNYFYATEGSNIYYTHGGPYVPEYHKTTGEFSEVNTELNCEEQYEIVRSVLDGQRQVPEMQRNLLTTKAGCWRASGKDGFIEYLNAEVRPGLNKKSKLYATSLELENLFLMDKGEYEKAITNFEEIRSNFSTDAQLHQQALFGLGYIHSIIKEDTETGISFFEELVKTYPDAELAKHSLFLAEAFDFAVKQKVGGDEGQDEVSLTNYPNPFNPLTEIKFSLPENGYVKLRVFDILGREVGVLVDNQLEAGVHSFAFDAANLSSGIYLYRLEFANKVITNKMTLIK